MNRILCLFHTLLLTAFLSSGTALAQSEPEVRQPEGLNKPVWFNVTISPASALTNGAYVGGEIVMKVEFISTEPFQRLRMSLPAIRGAKKETLSQPRTSQVNVFGATGYAEETLSGYRHSLTISLVPQESGVLIIPAIVARGIAQPRARNAYDFEEVYPAKQIKVHPPSPRYAGDTWIVARDASLTESWTPDVTEVESGDTIRREATLTVRGVKAADLPPLFLEATEGHRVLTTESAATTEVTAEGHVTTLRQHWDIYVESNAITTVNPIRFTYWNPITERTSIEELAAQRLEPLPADAEELRAEFRARALAEHQAKEVGLLALLAIPIAAVAAFVLLVLWHCLPSRADLGLLRAARRRDGLLAFYGDVSAWWRRTFGNDIGARRGEASRLGPAANRQIEGLHQSLFGRRADGGVSASSVASSLVVKARTARVKQYLGTIGPSLARFLFLR